MNPTKKSFQYGGHTVTLETGEIARQADGAVIVNMADTVVLVTAVGMKELEEPWIAFKVLAQGAIHPRVAFPWCFENGADFLCVGMFDFELVENVNLACEVLASNIPRSRPWRLLTKRRVAGASCAASGPTYLRTRPRPPRRSSNRRQRIGVPRNSGKPAVAG